MRKLTSFLALFGAIAAFLPNGASAEPASPPPPFEAVYQPQGVDEVGLWKEDDEAERRLASSPVVIQDEELNAYIKEVLCNAVGDDRCNAVRIYIIREPTFNATITPNGTMRIFSGLLLRMRNEAELASVLGHEFGHFEKRHSLAEFKRMRSGSDLGAWGGLLLGTVSRYGGGYYHHHGGQSLDLIIYGNLYRYNRAQEREADILGLGYLNNSHFPPLAASAVWQNLMQEIDASANIKGLKKPDHKAVAFTASHPPHEERAGYLRELALPDVVGRNDWADRYKEKLAPWIPVFLEDQIKLNDFGASEYIIESLAESGWTADLWFARGELYRTRGNQRDLVAAVEFYNNAIAAGDAPAEAYRGLGLSLFKTGNRTQGQEMLRQYLELKPDAVDAKIIGMMVAKEVVQ